MNAFNTIIILFFFSISISLQAQNVDPLLAGNLQEEVDNMRNSFNLVGWSVAVSLDNGDIWTGTSGYSSETDSLMPDMVIGVASNTKTFMAALILLLVEEGQLSLNDALHQYLPSYENIDPDITIRQLLQHTSGVYNFTAHPNFQTSMATNSTYIWTPEEVFETFVLEPSFTAGSDWGYSNTNYLLLGLVVEEITGNTIATELRNRIFTPLDLNATYFPLEDSIPDDLLAHLWSDLFSPGTPADLFGLGLSINAICSSTWAAAAIASTAENMARWNKALFSGEVLTPALQAEQLDFHVVNSDHAYGLGTSRIRLADQTMVLGHTGDKVYKSIVSYSDMDNVSIAILSNDSAFDFTEMTQAVLTLLEVIRNFEPVNTFEPAEQLEIKAFPNPFSEQFRLQCHLDEPAIVSLDIYDFLGRRVAVLANSRQLPAGDHDFLWREAIPGGQKLEKGCYYYNLQVDGRSHSGKLLKW